MTAEPEPVETPEETPSGASRAAGGCVLTVLGLVPLAVIFAVSREAGVLVTVGATTGVVWWHARRVPPAPNPAPPPPPEGAPDEKPQFTVVDDPDNPARSHVVWHRTETA